MVEEKSQIIHLRNFANVLWSNKIEYWFLWVYIFFWYDFGIIFKNGLNEPLRVDNNKKVEAHNGCVYFGFQTYSIK